MPIEHFNNINLWQIQILMFLNKIFENLFKKKNFWSVVVESVDRRSLGTNSWLYFQVMSQACDRRQEEIPYLLLLYDQ